MHQIWYVTRVHEIIMDGLFVFNLYWLREVILAIECYNSEIVSGVLSYGNGQTEHDNLLLNAAWSERDRRLTVSHLSRPSTSTMVLPFS